MVYENIITGVEEEKLLPYEKCLEYGASSLDNAELLAAIISCLLYTSDAADE